MLAVVPCFGSVGVEGTGSYGAGLARRLAAAGVCLVEVNRPNRRERRRGKSDALDAQAAARAALGGHATAQPSSNIAETIARRPAGANFAFSCCLICAMSPPWEP